MNREILFRGKRTDNGEWVEGAFLNDRDGAFCICPAVSDITYGDNGNRRRIGCWYKVDPATVGQFTGLVDKNGVRIFEGDVVQDDRPECRLLSDTKKGEKRRGIAAVRFGQHEVPSDDPFCWGNAYGFYFDGDTLRPTPAQYKPYDEYADGTFEVIGNIHDNKEL